MLRCSSFMKIKCNWYRMGIIVLTVKRNNYKKLHCQKQPQGSMLQYDCLANLFGVYATCWA